MEKRILKQIEAVREDGSTNMFDLRGVYTVAKRLDLFSLENYAWAMLDYLEAKASGQGRRENDSYQEKMEDRIHEYWTLIMKGPEAIKVED